MDRRKVAVAIIMDAWWEGLILWYNHQDYLSAMECWEDAMEKMSSSKYVDVGNRHIQQRSEHANDDNDDDNIVDEDSSDDALMTRFETLIRRLGNSMATGHHKHESDDTDATDDNHDDDNDNGEVSVAETTSFASSVVSSSSSSSAAPLWLFLAGCQLDAREYRKARTTLLRCLLECCTATNETTARIVNARKGRGRIQQTQTPPSSAIIVQRALSEWIASYEEQEEQEAATRAVSDDEKEDGPAVPPTNTATTMGYRVAYTALVEAQIPYMTWSNPYQRPGYMYTGCPQLRPSIRHPKIGSSSSSSSSTPQLSSSFPSMPLSPCSKTTTTTTTTNNAHNHDIHNDYDSRHKHHSYPNIPVYQSSDFNWCHELETNQELYHTIRNEFLHAYYGSNRNHGNDGIHHTRHRNPHSSKDGCSFYAVGSGEHRNGAGEHDGQAVLRGCWNECVLFSASTSEDGNLAAAPATCRWIVENVPDAVSLAREGGGEIIFSVMGPTSTHIQSHCGTTNVRLTAHLGLVVPSSMTTQPTGMTQKKKKKHCHIRIADEWHTWEEGKVLVFDDSYEHEVINDTNEIRAVLLFRFWHPNVPQDKRRHALEDALQSKRHDELRRYNPPMPIGLLLGCDDCDRVLDTIMQQQKAIANAVEKRGLEVTTCPRCWNTGYQSLRVTRMAEDSYYGASTDNYAHSNGINDVHHKFCFVCSCGEPIRP